MLISLLGRPLLGLLFVMGSSACGDVEEVPFRITLDDQRCAKSATEGFPIEVFLAPLDTEGSHLCLLSQTELASRGSVPILETGADLSADEVVVIALVRSGGDCVECYGLLRLLLQRELTDYTLELTPTASCDIPAAARDALALPAGALPPTTACR